MPDLDWAVAPPERSKSTFLEQDELMRREPRSHRMWHPINIIDSPSAWPELLRATKERSVADDEYRSIIIDYLAYTLGRRRVASDLLADSDLLIGLTLMETGQWVAIDNLVGEYGEGQTCAAAVQDLIVSLFESRDRLEQRQRDLHPRLTKQLDALRASLKEEMR